METTRPGRVILRVDAGADHGASASRTLADTLVSRLVADGDVVTRRHATEGLPVVTGAWVSAAFADGDPAALAMSNALVDELLGADELVLVAPVYNFGIPAAMKAWIDQVVRAGRTFQLTEQGPVGLATGVRRAWIVTASGSTQIGGEYDFNTTYLRTVLGFIGIADVRVIGAMQLQLRGEAAFADALEAMEVELAT